MRGRKTKTRRPVKTNQWLAQDPEDGRLAIFERTVKGVRVKWKVGRTYAVQPGRGKKAWGYATLGQIRDERVKDISERDAIEEGVVIPEHKRGVVRLRGGAPVARTTYRMEFALLWDSINAKRGYGWNDNPPVWALTFSDAERTE